MSHPQPLVFFTICSKNFLAYARTLCASVREHHPGARFHVALCDRVDGMIDLAAEPFEIVELSGLEIPGLDGMIAQYNITELNTAIKPFVFEYLFSRCDAQRVVYLDPDILVVSPLAEVDAHLGVDADAILTPHVLDPAENVEIDDIKMLQLGTYNLGFVAFNRTPEVRGIVRWWARRLHAQCVIDVPNGLFVDQKWADLLPSFIPRTRILHHPGYNVAYWNLPQRRVSRTASGWTVNGQPLAFFHFSGNDLYNEEVFARHSPSLTMAKAGDAAELLREYRAKVFANGHAHYATLPYAFNWNGASGRNEHTPEEVAVRTRAAAAVPASSAATAAAPASTFPVPVRPSASRRVANALTTLRRARRHAGNLPAMLVKAASVYRRGGFGLVRDTIRQLNLMYPVVNRGEVASAVPVADYADPQAVASLPQVQDGRPRLLFIDWSTPRPDCDAGSITAFYLMKILVDLGYHVVFAPNDMLRLGHYTETLESIGVTCLSADRHGPLHEHIVAEGARYDYALICRAPFAAKWLDAIREHASRARVILNTADLYFLREIREAELEGSAEKLEAALRWKEEELDIIRRCDHCIVMSDHEQAILAREAPDARVHLVPLMFVDIPGRAAGFDARRDLLFIGGYLHRPNVDAAVWFCERVWPRVRERLPGVRVHLLGSNPTDDVRALSKQAGVEVVGFVEDLKPWFDAIRLSIAPLRYGAGIKGKLGTSLSFGVPSVATAIAVEGMHLRDGEHVLVADDEAEFADAVVRLYTDGALWERISAAGLDFVADTYSLDAGLRRVGAFMAEVSAHCFPATRIGTVEDYAAYHAADPGRFLRRWSHEASLVPAEGSDFEIDGWCAACESATRFRTDFHFSGTRADGSRPLPNWREQLACIQCGSSNRIRAALHAFRSLSQPGERDRIYVTEQATSTYAWLRERYPETQGSEYFGDRVPYGEAYRGFRNENLMATTWSDAEFDHVLSFDVLEHVPDPLAALRECARILRPGGTLLWSAPFAFENGWHLRPGNTVLAEIDASGRTVFHAEPEYHENPVDPEGKALCFRHFGLEALDLMREAGFADARILLYWSSELGYLGCEQVLCHARKPG